MIFDRLIPRALRPTDSCLAGIKLNLLFMKEMSLGEKFSSVYFGKRFSFHLMMFKISSLL